MWGFPLQNGSGPSLKGAFFGFKAMEEHAPDPPGIHPNWMQADVLIIWLQARAFSCALLSPVTGELD